MKDSEKGRAGGQQDRPTCASLFGHDDPYVRFLLDNRERLFYLKPWNGNSGDVLIWLGTERLLGDLDIRRTLDPRAADVILIPGGNQTMWQGNIKVWKEVWSKYPGQEFAVGPTTVHFGATPWDEDVRRSQARILAIFARDPVSHANLAASGLPAGMITGLSHDPALYLRDSQLIREHREAATEEFVLAVFRDDQEGSQHLQGLWGRQARRWMPRLSARIGRHLRNVSRQRKIAQVRRYTRSEKPLRICDVSQYPLEYFIEIIRSAAEVHTDRLHCMLMAAMLGKSTFAYPTTYAKLEAVYVHSVRAWAHVEFVAGTQEALLGAHPLQTTDGVADPAMQDARDTRRGLGCEREIRGQGVMP